MKNVFDLIRQPLVIGAFALSALIVVGVYFGSYWYYGNIEPVPEEVLDYTPTPAVSRGRSKERSSWNDNSETGSVLTNSSSDVPVQADDELGDFSDFEDTPVYYFPDGTPVPEDLLCPEKWIGVYQTEVSNSEFLEVEAHIKQVAQKIVNNYNPNRPMSEVWPLYIEAEANFLNQSEAVLPKGVSPIAGMRIDWAYEQLYRFPEIQAVRLEDNPPSRLIHMYMVELGALNPDWNLTTLPDGRDFRVKYGRRYIFSQTREMGSATNTGTFEICYSDPNTAETIYVNLDETSDAELEQIGGWNYNHNPYTGE